MCYPGNMYWDPEVLNKLFRGTTVLPDGCWEHRLQSMRYAWDYEVDDKPYPLMSSIPRMWYFWSVRADPPQGMKKLHVRHLCPNRNCCNPAHLILGTATDNQHDRNYKWDDPRFEELRAARAESLRENTISSLGCALATQAKDDSSP